ncbi:MAG: biopolymer transporter ExbD [Rhodobacteraceae bacterium]|jgi:biopolymer transport protein ExbD|nr:biopolymer transporter ExbD [Paracoccaceae bacterium]
MRFAPPARREPRETVVPMINVVFLLLIFLLLSATLAPAPPVDVTLPEARADAADPGEATLHIAADGTLAMGALRGEAALAALPPGARVEIRADAGLPAAALAALLPRLAGAGEVVLVTVPP